METLTETLTEAIWQSIALITATLNGDENMGSKPYFELIGRCLRHAMIYKKRHSPIERYQMR